jgi:hypothetical protein
MALSLLFILTWQNHGRHKGVSNMQRAFGKGPFLHVLPNRQPLCNPLIRRGGYHCDARFQGVGGGGGLRVGPSMRVVPIALGWCFPAVLVLCILLAVVFLPSRMLSHSTLGCSSMVYSAVAESCTEMMLNCCGYKSKAHVG